MAGHLRLQDPRTLNGPATQEREYSADVGSFNYVSVQVRVLKADPAAGTLRLQHAAVNEESAYVDAASAVEDTDLTSTAGNVYTLSHPLRFLRWAVTGNVTDATFLIDLVARE